MNLQQKADAIDALRTDSRVAAPAAAAMTTRPHQVPAETVITALASDAAHLYANLTRGIPFPIFVDEADYRQAQARVMEIAGGSLDHVIPGHDPLVLTCFPSDNDIARVDLPPLAPIARTQ